MAKRRAKAPSRGAMQRRKHRRVAGLWAMASYATGPAYARVYGAWLREARS